MNRIIIALAFLVCLLFDVYLIMRVAKIENKIDEFQAYPQQIPSYRTAYYVAHQPTMGVGKMTCEEVMGDDWN